MADDDIEVPADLPVAGTSAPETSEPLAQPDKAAPSTGTEQPDKETAVASTEAEQKAEEPASEDKSEKSEKKPPWFVERLARQREELAQVRQEKQEYLQRLQAYEQQQQQQQRQDPDHQQQQRMPSQAELQQYVRAEAARMAEQREMQLKLSSFDNAGRSAYPDFVDRCNTLASLGAAENPVFMQAVTAMEDGHKVVAQLAENPQKAIEILSLPPISMAVALARFAHQAPRPPPVSKAPSPVRPIHGQAHVDPDASKMSDAEWFRKFPGGAGAQSKG